MPQCLRLRRTGGDGAEGDTGDLTGRQMGRDKGKDKLKTARSHWWIRPLHQAGELPISHMAAPYSSPTAPHGPSNASN